MTRLREIPPTAGLPITLRDLWPSPNSGDFAEQLGQQFNIPRPQLTCSGTAALLLILRSFMASSPRRRVIIPAYTCPLVAMAVDKLGLEVQLCDLAPNAIDFDFSQLAQLMDENTLAVVPTHLGGRLVDVARAAAMAQPLGVKVIEDAAQALGAQQGGQTVGLCGDAAFFSLAIGKGLTTFEGGVAFSKHPEVMAQLREMATDFLPVHWLWELRRCVELIGYSLFYRPRMLAWIYGPAFRRQCAQGNWLDAVGDVFNHIPVHQLGSWRQQIGLKALARLPEFLSHCQQQAARRCWQLAAIPKLQVLTDGPLGQGTWPFIMVILPTKTARDLALQELVPLGLGATRLYIHSLPDYAYLAPIFHSPPYALPNARHLADTLLTLSNSLWLEDTDFNKLLEVLRQCVM